MSSPTRCARVRPRAYPRFPPVRSAAASPVAARARGRAAGAPQSRSCADRRRAAGQTRRPPTTRRRQRALPGRWTRWSRSQRRHWPTPEQRWRSAPTVVVHSCRATVEASNWTNAMPELAARPEAAPVAAAMALTHASRASTRRD